MPTDPNGGFEVKVVEPERALVLLVDNEIVARRPDQTRIDAASTPGLAASGRFMQASMPPEFAVSWAMVLQPLDGGRTRLIERVRATYGSTTRGTRAFSPMLGFGVFLMTRRQMLGLAERASATQRIRTSRLRLRLRPGCRRTDMFRDLAEAAPAH